MMRTGILPVGEPGIFKTFLLPEAAKAAEQGEPLTILGLADEDVACGALAGYVTERSFRIVSLYVAPAYRKRGGGRMLLSDLRALLAKAGAVDGMEIDFTVTGEEHRDLQKFLTAEGFFADCGVPGGIYRTTLREIAGVPFFAQSKESGENFTEMSSRMLLAMEKEAAADGAFLPEGGLTGSQIDRECSVAVQGKTGLAGLAVLDRSCGGDLTLACAWCKNNQPALLAALLHSAFARARGKYPPETPVAVQAVTPVSQRLVEKLLPEAEKISCRYLWFFGEDEEEPELIEYQSVRRG